jgi:Domain of unknown function (DUF4347)/Concanavalin A-like lectin/glucanases superfamily/PA14 domain/RTX calcium-binding nonapeptide repeat (4 copies)/Calx-beta domain/WD40-like Beta Propeller Repeat
MNNTYHLIFIDPTVDNYETLINGVIPGTEVILLDLDKNGITQITDILAKRHNLDSIQIVSHGNNGTLYLGNSQLNAENVNTYSNELTQWGESLTESGDIFLYGCNVAMDNYGKNFVNILSNITNADVIASENVTGNHELGGDWVLEYHTGEIENPLAFQTETLTNYEGVLVSGLTGYYWKYDGKNDTYNNSNATQINNENINIDFDKNGTIAGQKDFFTRWEGYVITSTSGNYKFQTRNDDGIRVYLDKNRNNTFSDDEKIISDWDDNQGDPDKTESGWINLTTETPYKIKVEFYDQKDDAVAQLRWQTPNSSYSIIPKENFLPINYQSPKVSVQTINVTNNQGYEDDLNNKYALRISVDNTNNIPDLGLSIPYTISGTATNNLDYTDSFNGKVIFKPGETYKDIILIKDDYLKESNETITVTIQNGSLYTLGNSSATLTIQDNEPIFNLKTDPLNPTIKWDEGGKTFNFNLEKTSGDIKSGGTPVYYRITNINETNKNQANTEDFTLLDGTVTYTSTSNTNNQTFAAQIIKDDLIYEGETSETFTIELKTDTGYDLGSSTKITTFSIQENEPLINISPDQSIANEGKAQEAANQVISNFKIDFNRPSPQNFDLYFYLSGTGIPGTFANTKQGSDYKIVYQLFDKNNKLIDDTKSIAEPIIGTNKLTVSKDTKFIKVQIQQINDEIYEGDENVTITLLDNYDKNIADGYGVDTSKNLATITIKDNEPLISISKIVNPTEGFGFGSTINALGKALNLKGDNYVKITQDGKKLDFEEGTFTLESWVFPNLKDTQYYPIIFGDSQTANNRFPTLGIVNKTDIQASFSDGTNEYIIKVNKVLNADVWNQVATTFDGTDYKIFVNGVEVYSTTQYQGKKPISTSQNILIGSDGKNNFSGTIDEVRIWNKAKTQAEIQQNLLNISVEQQEGLIGYWQFEGNLVDNSGNNNTANLVGNNNSLFIDNPAPQIGYVELTLDKPVDLVQGLWVDYTINSNSTATQNIDYYNSRSRRVSTDKLTERNNIIIPEGETSARIYFSALPDAISEGDETLNITLVQNNFDIFDANNNGTIEWGEFPQSFDLDNDKILDTDEQTLFKSNYGLNSAASSGTITIKDNQNYPVGLVFLDKDNQVLNNNNPLVVDKNGQTTFKVKLTSQPVKDVTVNLTNNKGTLTTNKVDFEPSIAQNVLKFINGSYIDLPAKTIPTVKGTIEYWVNLATNDQTQAIVYTSNGTYRGDLEIATVLTSEGRPRFTYRRGDINKSATIIGNTKLNTNQWYHIAVTYDANNDLRLYVNGEEDSTPVKINKITFSDITPNKAFIGKTGQDNSWFDGKLDEVRIWNSPRTKEQIKADFNRQLKGNETGLIAYYSANENSKTTLIDYSSQGNNGTISGSITRDIDTDLTSKLILKKWDQPQTVTITGLQPNTTLDITAKVNSLDSKYNNYQKTQTFSLAKFDDLKVTEGSTTDGANVTPVVSIFTVENINEGEGKTGQFKLQLSFPAPENGLTINYEVKGSAINGQDYENIGLNLVIPEGETTAIIPILPINDNLKEQQETVTINLTQGQGYQLNNVNQTATINLVDDESASIKLANVVDPDNNTFSDSFGTIITDEDGNSQIFGIRLNSQPTANVTINLKNIDQTESSLSVTSLTFTPDNWNQYQSIKVTGVNDLEIDGDFTYTILAESNSNDPNYNPKFAYIEVKNLDNDDDIDEEEGTGQPIDTSLPIATLNLDKSEILENQKTVNFTINLLTKPTKDTLVIFSINSESAILGEDLNLQESTLIQKYVVSEKTNQLEIYNPTIHGEINPSGLLYGVNFLTGETSKTFTLNIVDDLKDESTAIFAEENDQVIYIEKDNETVEITLNSYQGYRLDDSENSNNLYRNTLTINDNDLAGITVTPQQNTNITSETGTSLSYQVVLNTEPLTPVKVYFSSNNTREGLLTTNLQDSQSFSDLIELEFTPENWQQPQTFFVVGIDDKIDDGKVVYQVTRTTESEDLHYHNLPRQEYSFTNENDADKAGIIITKPGETIEGRDNVFSVKLTSEPESQVMVIMTPDRDQIYLNNEKIGEPLTLYFDGNNWNQEQTIRVQAYDDNIVEFNQLTNLNVEIITPTKSALDFNQNDLKLSLDLAVNSNQFTQEFWFNSSQINQILVNLTTQNTKKSVFLENGNLVVKNANNQVLFATNNLNLSTGKWYHLAYTNGEKLYLNGQLVASNNTINEQLIPQLLLEIPQEFEGTIREIRTWNIGRSQAQIQGTMTEELYGDEAGLIAYYKADEAIGNLLLDSTNNQNHLTLTSENYWVKNWSEDPNYYHPQFTPAPLPVTIIDNDLPTAKITAGKTASEIFAEPSYFNISLNAPLPKLEGETGLEINYRLVGGTAILQTEYQLGDYRMTKEGTVRVDPGNIQGNLIVSPIDDKVAEDWVLTVEKLQTTTLNNELILTLSLIQQQDSLPIGTKLYFDNGVVAQVKETTNFEYQPIDLVSISSNGALGNAESFDASISSDGRYIAFESSASNLVENDNNGTKDIFVHDRQTGATKIITQGNYYDYQLLPSISGDGRYIAFQGNNNILVYDSQTGETKNIAQGNNQSLNDDGRYIAFESSASNLVTNDTNNQQDIFVYDRQTGVTKNITQLGNGESRFASISGDGRYIVFDSMASNLVVNDKNSQRDVFVHDLQTKETKIITQGNGSSGYPDISGDGRYIVFESSASDLAANDNNGQDDIFVYDRQTGQTKNITLLGNRSSFERTISGNGRYIAFESNATNLVANDNNNQTDIFIYDQFSNSIRQLENTKIKYYRHIDFNQTGDQLVFVSEANLSGVKKDNFKYDVFIQDPRELYSTKVKVEIDPQLKDQIQKGDVAKITGETLTVELLPGNGYLIHNFAEVDTGNLNLNLKSFTNGTITFEVSLKSQPSNNSVVTFNDGLETVQKPTNTGTITFTPNNWNQTQVVSLINLDLTENGYQIKANQDGNELILPLVNPQATLSIQDDDIPGVRIVNVGEYTTVREQQTALFEVSLLSEPTAPVKLTLTPGSEIDFVNPIDPTTVLVDKDNYYFDESKVNGIDVDLHSLVITNIDQVAALDIRLNTKPTGDVTVILEDDINPDNGRPTVLTFTEQEYNPVTGDYTEGNWSQYQQPLVNVLDADENGQYRLKVTIIDSQGQETVSILPVIHEITQVQKQTTTITINPEDWYKLKPIEIKGSTNDIAEPGVFRNTTIDYVVSSVDTGYNQIFVPQQTIQVVDRLLDSEKTSETIDQGLDVLQESLDNITLPLIGKMDATPDLIGSFSTDLTKAIAAEENLTAKKLQEITENVLDSIGLDSFNVTTEVTDEEIKVLIDINKTYNLFSLPLSFDLGLPALGLTMDGSIEADFSYYLGLGFGFHNDFGFYIDTDKTKIDGAITLYLEGDEGDNFSGTGSVGFLNLDFEDDSSNPSKIEVSFEAGINDLDNYQGVKFFDVDGDYRLDKTDFQAEILVDNNGDKTPDRNTTTGDLITTVQTVKEPFKIIGQNGISPTFTTVNTDPINWNKNTTYDGKYLGEGDYKQKTITNINGSTTIKYYFDANKNGKLDTSEEKLAVNSTVTKWIENGTVKEFEIEQKKNAQGIPERDPKGNLIYYFDRNGNNRFDDNATVTGEPTEQITSSEKKRWDKNNNNFLDSEVEGEGKYVQGTGIAFQDTNRNGQLDITEPIVYSDFDTLSIREEGLYTRTYTKEEFKLNVEGRDWSQFAGENTEKITLTFLDLNNDEKWQPKANESLLIVNQDGSKYLDLNNNNGQEIGEPSAKEGESLTFPLSLNGDGFTGRFPVLTYRIGLDQDGNRSILQGNSPDPNFTDSTTADLPSIPVTATIKVNANIAQNMGVTVTETQLKNNSVVDVTIQQALDISPTDTEVSFLDLNGDLQYSTQLNNFEPLALVHQGARYIDVDWNRELNRDEFGRFLEPFAYANNEFNTDGFVNVDPANKAPVVKYLDDGKRLTLTEINNWRKDPNLTWKDLFNYEFLGEANLGLKTKTSVMGSEYFPSFSFDLAANLPLFNYNDQGSAQLFDNVTTVEFNNVQLDLGKTLSGFIAPFIDITDEIIDPIKPIITLLNADTKLFKYVGLESAFNADGKNGVSLLDVAKTLNPGNPTLDKVIVLTDTISTIVKLIDVLADIPKDESIIINFGDHSLDDFKNASNQPKDSSANIRSTNSTSVTTQNPSQSPLNQSQNSSQGKTVNTLKSLDGIELKLFEPVNALRLILGEPDVDLILYNVPDLGFDFYLLSEFPIYPTLIYGLVEGGLDVATNIDVGYDTHGIEAWKKSDFNIKDIYKVLDGFYLGDLDSSGADKEELTVDSILAAGLGISLGVIKGEVKGGIKGHIGFDIQDVGEKAGTSDGKVRGSEIISRLDTPLELFELNGKVDAFLGAAIKVGFGLFWTTVWEKDFARFTLAKFTIGGESGSQSGSVSQGYISHSQVFFDANFNQELDEDEPWTLTNSYGQYVLDIPLEYFDTNGNGQIDVEEGQIVAKGGVDVSSGLTRNVKLISPVGSGMMTPITTLTQKLVEQGLNVADSEQLVLNSLQLPQDIKLSEFDYLEELGQGNLQAIKLSLLSVQLQNIYSHANAFLAGLKGEDTGEYTNEILSAFMDIFADLTSNPTDVKTLDLTNPELLTFVFQKLTEKITLTNPVTQEIIATSAQIVAESNELIKPVGQDTLSKNVINFVPTISGVKHITQGELTEITNDLAQGNLTYQEALIDAENRLNSPFYLVTGGFPGLERSVTINVSDQLIEGAEVKTSQFTVTLNEPAPNQGLTVLYNISGNANQGKDYQINSQTLGQVYIKPNESSATIDIEILDDNLKENPETITIKLIQSGEGFEIDTTANLATLNLVDNDLNSTRFDDRNLNNIISGNNRDNLIIDNQGNDFLSGGKGADTFILKSPDFGFNHLTDFNPLEGDRLLLSAQGFNIHNLSEISFVNGILSVNNQNIALLSNQDQTYAYFPNLFEVIKLDKTPELRPKINFDVLENTEKFLNYERFEHSFFDEEETPLRKIKVTSLPENGTLKLQGETVTIDQLIPITEINNLSYTPNTGFNGYDHFNWNGTNGYQYAISDGEIQLKVLTNILGTNDSENLTGGDLFDHIKGLKGDDTIFGGQGDDILKGNVGNDRLIGNQGDDILIGGLGNDTLNGGLDTDIANFFTQDSLFLDGHIVIGQGNDTLLNIEKVALIGNNNDNLLDATKSAEFEQVILSGKDGNDTLLGSQNNDLIYGGKGEDLIDGGTGLNVIFGGEEKDTFVLHLGAENKDIIRDFEPGLDKLQLPEGISYGDLTIKNSPNNENTFVKYQKDILAVLSDLDADLITESDFII